MAIVEEVTTPGKGDILVSFAATDEGTCSWGLRGNDWAYYNDAGWAGEGEFPLWKCLYRSARSKKVDERTVFVGPAADPAVTVVFAAQGERYRSDEQYRHGNGIHSLETDFTLARVSPPIIFVNIPHNPDGQDGRVTLIPRKSREVVTADLTTDAVFETVGHFLSDFKDSPGRRRKADRTPKARPAERGTMPTSVGDLVALTFVDRLAPDVAEFLEPLLAMCDEALDGGACDEPTSETLARDRSYLRHQLYECASGLDTAIVNAVARRMLRILGPAVLEPDESALVGRLLDVAPDATDADDAIKAADNLAMSIDAGAVPSGHSAHDWIATQLGWYRYVAHITAAQAGATIRDEGAGFVALSSGVTTVLVALGVSGPAAVLAAVYVALLARSWRNSRG